MVKEVGIMADSIKNLKNNFGGYDTKYCGSFYKREESIKLKDYCDIKNEIFKEDSLSINNIILENIYSFMAKKLINSIQDYFSSQEQINAMNTFFTKYSYVMPADKYKIYSNIIKEKNFSTQEKLLLLDEINNLSVINRNKTINILKKLLEGNFNLDKRLKKHIQNKITLLKIAEKSKFVIDLLPINQVEPNENNAEDKSDYEHKKIVENIENIKSNIIRNLDIITEIVRKSDTIQNDAFIRSQPIVSINNSDDSISASIVMPEEKDKIDVNTKIISSNYDYKTTINCLNDEIKDQISKLLIILNNETKLPKQENTNIENFVNLTENSELVNKEEVMSVNHLNQDDLQDNRIDNDSLNAIFKNTSNELNYKPSITKTLVNSKEYFKFGAGVERETDFFSILLPSGYIAESNITEGKVFMYLPSSRNFNREEQFFYSPLVICVNRLKNKNIANIPIFFSNALNECTKKKMKYKNTSVNGYPAVIKYKNDKNIFYVSVLNYREDCLYEFKFTFNGKVNNKTSIVQRILSGIRFGGAK